jgi:hypothetical protein
VNQKTYQAQYRKDKTQKGWKYFSIMVPASCYTDLKKFYLKWKIDNLQMWDKENKK